MGLAACVCSFDPASFANRNDDRVESIGRPFGRREADGRCQLVSSLTSGLGLRKRLQACSRICKQNLNMHPQWYGDSKCQNGSHAKATLLMQLLFYLINYLIESRPHLALFQMSESGISSRPICCAPRPGTFASHVTSPYVNARSATRGTCT